MFKKSMFYLCIRLFYFAFKRFKAYKLVDICLGKITKNKFDTYVFPI